MRITREVAEDLVLQGLAKKNMVIHPVLGELTLFKYARSVFYKNLWTPELEQLRGTVFHGDTLAVQAMLKVYNYGERDAGKDLSMDTPVYLDYKVNGFMLNVTVIGDELVFSTTGSLTSDFVELGAAVFFSTLSIRDIEELKTFEDYTTFTFEVVHPSDPHIVQEKEGLYLLRISNHSMGLRNRVAEAIKCNPVEGFVTTLGEALKLAETAKHEGWMVYPAHSFGEPFFKLKTKYYLTTKFLMRSKKASDMVFKDQWPVEDEEFFKLVQAIRDTFSKESWEGMCDQTRRHFVETFFQDNGAF